MGAKRAHGVPAARAGPVGAGYGEDHVARFDKPPRHLRHGDRISTSGDREEDHNQQGKQPPARGQARAFFSSGRPMHVGQTALRSQKSTAPAETRRDVPHRGKIAEEGKGTTECGSGHAGVSGEAPYALWWQPWAMKTVPTVVTAEEECRLSGRRSGVFLRGPDLETARRPIPLGFS